jgi:phosphohistidine phosphatase SixA
MKIPTSGRCLSLALCCSSWLALGSAELFADSDETLWDALRSGGKVVLLRHAPIERGGGSVDPRLRDPSCRAEAQLSAQGRNDAKELGRRFREHQVPVSSVLHSPYCRTTDTATIAFGEALPAAFLSLIDGLPPDLAAEQNENLEQAIRNHAGDGTLVLVTHGPNVAAVSFELLRHLDALVLAPDGAGGFDEVGVLRFSGSD